MLWGSWEDLYSLKRLSQILLPSVALKKVGYWNTPGVAIKPAEVARKKSNDWPLIDFIHSVGERRIYRVFRINRLDGIANYTTASAFIQVYLLKNIIFW